MARGRRVFILFIIRAKPKGVLACDLSLMLDHPQEVAVPRSVLDAIRLGLWDYEPDEIRTDHFSRTDALPGTRDKLSVLAERVRLGLPLWHPSDRANCEGMFGPDEEDE